MSFKEAKSLSLSRRLVDKASFPHATAVRKLTNDVIFVQLYDKIEEPFTSENVFKQWKWREWLDYDSLEEKYG